MNLSFRTVALGASGIWLAIVVELALAVAFLSVRHHDRLPPRR